MVDSPKVGLVKGFFLRRQRRLEGIFRERSGWRNYEHVESPVGRMGAKFVRENMANRMQLPTNPLMERFSDF